ncbi:molybdopterin-dependent oxidoreductase alpha subunit [Kribbella sp. VKM Ac-2527]|uniref:Molybdopterin-dependent oxidoreductase alpha subunit n=1 Tax=Kribbella caucasensis TaxID=2512215 RepID=A0A4R6JHX0_9ACTN|nr:FdhF/YdeP family oxidoreductase [Kribbella sp. VKM Ac-2527]TDO35704.1 molybdopterin-dependent oxidoreductase alpha subunit [Kribbella sp. VKM Ac-2527]
MVDIEQPKKKAAGVPAVLSSFKFGFREMGPVRTGKVFLKMNQDGGFDCPSCAWPDPDHKRKHAAEFCENGAKAVAWEATRKRVPRSFFAEHTIADLQRIPEYELGKLGRITEPMLLRAGADHYEPIGWDEAFHVVARHLRGLDTPDDAVFYTSGRTSNEAAFLYQLMVRAYGTNNLPDCSNMCHESSGTALTRVIGSGKGAVTLEMLEQAELIVVVGQNPGTNAPRMLSHLEIAKRNGAGIVSVNPLPEPGLINFKNPQRASGWIGKGTALADQHLQIRIGGDQALFLAVGHLLLEAEKAAPGTVVDKAFIEQHTSGFELYAKHNAELDWAAVELATGLTRAEIEEFTQRFIKSKATVICWAMGLTQHREAVATITEIVNVLLLQGNIGKPGAGPCPVRGHSNVQGDRSMGIWEKVPDAFLDRLDTEFAITSPREHGLDAAATVQRLREGSVRVFFAMGGNFAAATPDTAVVERGLRSCDLTVHVSTKLNRSHTVAGREALILPTLGRTDHDHTAAGPQSVTVEDSQGAVHLSTGNLIPPAAGLKSEVGIVCGLATVLVPDVGEIPWADFAEDYSLVRQRIGRVCDGYEDFEDRLRSGEGGFLLAHAARDRREFRTSDARAQFSANELTWLPTESGRLLLQTMRSHDQFNTTIYGLEDRYRGVHGTREVVFVNPLDLDDLGLVDGQVVDIVSEFNGEERRAVGFRLVSYPTARGCAAAYYPETNVLMSADDLAKGSNTPVAKGITIRLEPQS